MLFRPDSGEAPALLDLPSSLSYRAPDWSPDGRRFAFVGIPNGDAALMVAAADGANPKTLAPAPNVSAFAWSPRGDFIAFASTLAPNLTIFDRVTLVEPEDGASRVLAEGPIIAFFWSPGGDRLALMRLSDQGTHLILSVVDVKTGAGLDVAEFLPSQELQFMLSFFDQYKESHRIWSPDGRFLALSGVLAGDDPGAESQVYVVDASGGVPPRAVAAGTLAFWPPARGSLRRQRRPGATEHHALA